LATNEDGRNLIEVSFQTWVIYCFSSFLTGDALVG
jgi:hypothetical protein